MKRLTITFSIVLLFVSAAMVLGSVRFGEFTASPMDGYALITWTTEYESGVHEFAVERSIDGIEFMEVATFEPHGPGVQYRFPDTDLFKQGTRTFYYRIRCENVSGAPEYSDVQQTTIIISGIRQTWGSLKALFR